MKDWLKRHKLILLLSLCLGIFITLTIYILYFTNLFVLKEIKIYQNKRVTQEEIFKLLGLKGGERLFAINLKDLKEKLKTHPMIDEVVLTRKLPSLLEITIKEREGLAILVKGNRGFLVDKKGVVIGGILPQDYLYYPIVELKDEEWKVQFFQFLDWIKHNKRYLPVFENFSKIVLERDKIIFVTKNHLTIYFPLSVMEDWINLYKHLDRIMVYLYEQNLADKVELIRLDYPYGKALIKFRS